MADVFGGGDIGYSYSTNNVTGGTKSEPKVYST